MLKKVIFISGASGVGKTTLIEQLKNKYRDKSWRFLHFDSIGVPSIDEMIQQYGSPSGWQEAMTSQWIDKLVHQYEDECIFFEGQVNLQFIQSGFKQHSFTNYKLVLLDCSEEEMAYRLTHKRGQPELLTADMHNWLNYLRNQAKALGVKILDTTNKSNEQVVIDFEQLIS